jgi:ribosomal protein S18 acetylase RimI-like enzyme
LKSLLRKAFLLPLNQHYDLHFFRASRENSAMQNLYLHRMAITAAKIEDIPVLVALVNSAYRGEASKKGWTTEADLLEGEARTNIPTLTELMEKTSSLFLKYTDAGETIIGSVYLDIQDRGLYLGMLTVSPLLQGGGVGKQLMKAAEQYAKENNCSCIFMNVISVRHELIRWYQKNNDGPVGLIENIYAIDRSPYSCQLIPVLIREMRIPFPLFTCGIFQ